MSLPNAHLYKDLPKVREAQQNAAQGKVVSGEAKAPKPEQKPVIAANDPRRNWRT